MSAEPLMDHESGRIPNEYTKYLDEARHRNLSLSNHRLRSQFLRDLHTLLTCILWVLLSIMLICGIIGRPFTLLTIGPSTPSSTKSSLNLDLKPLQTRFGSDISYMSLDPQYDWLWSSESGKYGALIRLDTDNDDGSTQWGAITMFHQLHCLAGIRNALQRAQREEDIGMDYRNDTHWPHCLYYLRQSILCAADDTIELAHQWNTTTDANGMVTSKRVGAIDGSNDIRMCRDADPLFKIRAERGYKA